MRTQNQIATILLVYLYTVAGEVYQGIVQNPVASAAPGDTLTFQVIYPDDTRSESEKSQQLNDGTSFNATSVTLSYIPAGRMSTFGSIAAVARWNSFFDATTVSVTLPLDIDYPSGQDVLLTFDTACEFDDAALALRPGCEADPFQCSACLNALNKATFSTQLKITESQQ
jgi:hypothetical protein